MKPIFLIACLVFGSSASASGTFPLTGKVISFSPDFVTLQTEKNQYQINRKKMNPIDSAKITKANQVVTIQASFDSVQIVKANH